MDDGEDIEKKSAKRRKEVVYQCANPLFAQWLKEWRDEAVEKGWKIQHTYSRALKSLKKHPLTLKSPWEAKNLEYFGDKICKMLEEKLKEHNKNSNEILEFEVKTILDKDAVSSKNYTKIHQRENVIKNINSNLLMKSKQRRLCNKSYVPAPRTAAYAILITLIKNENEKKEIFMKKEQLKEFAQLFCNASFFRAEPGTRYTAWSAMGKLIKKGLTVKSSNPARYSLTAGGRELALSLMKTSWNVLNENNNEDLDINLKESNDNKIIDTQHQQTSTSRLMVDDEIYTYLHKNNCDLNEDFSVNTQLSLINSNHFNSNTNGKVILHSGTFDVVLVVDNCEVYAGSSKDHKMEVLKELSNMGVKHDIRKLHVGDFLWIAKKRSSMNEDQDEELVLNYIVERKRMDDLARSIKDGRFHEQKFRMKETGLKNLMYLVEEYGIDQYFGLPDASLKQAIINCQVIDGFLVTKTKNSKASVNYLTMLTRHLYSQYHWRELTSCSKDEYISSSRHSNSFITFQDFNSLAMKKKQLDVKEMFAKHLLQIYGMSADKAFALVNKYSTPARLLEAYEDCSDHKEKENLLSNITYGKNKRRIGPTLSQTVFCLYGMPQFK